MAGTVATMRVLRTQAARYGADVRSLGPWLVIALPFWWWTGRRAYNREQERLRELRVAPILKPKDQRRK